MRWGVHTGWRAGLLAVCVLAPMSTGATAVLAQPVPALELDWLAPAECPARESVSARIAEHLRESTGTNGPLRAQARVESSDELGYALSLRIDGPLGSSNRELHAQNCQAVADAAALLIALALDPNLIAATERAPAPPPAVSVEQPRPARPQPSPLQPEPPSPLFGAEFALLVDSGTLPGLGLGASLGLALTIDRLDFLLGGELLLATDNSLSGLAEGSTDFTSLLAVTRGCAPLLVAGSVSAGPCVLAELGSLRASTIGIDQPRSESELWFAAGAGLQGRIQLWRNLRASLSAFALAPHKRWRFWVQSPQGRRDVHRVAQVLGRLVVAIGGDFE